MNILLILLLIFILVYLIVPEEIPTWKTKNDIPNVIDIEESLLGNNENIDDIDDSEENDAPVFVDEIITLPDGIFNGDVVEFSHNTPKFKIENNQLRKFSQKSYESWGKPKAKLIPKQLVDDLPAGKDMEIRKISMPKYVSPREKGIWRGGCIPNTHKVGLNQWDWRKNTCSSNIEIGRNWGTERDSYTPDISSACLDAIGIDSAYANPNCNLQRFFY